jgi:hypothetical protein
VTTQTQHAKLWAKTVAVLAFGATVITFLLLNMNAVIEPRVHMIFFTYERPGLLLVLLLAALSGAALWTLMRAAPQAVRRLHKSRVAAQMAGMEREIAGLQAEIDHPAAAPVTR